MKKNIPLVLLFLMSFLSSCEVIGGIFKAGMWTGVLAVVFLVGIVVWVISRAGKGTK